MTRYIPTEYRANLSKYKYSGVDESLVSKYVLGPYWTKLVTFFPLSMAYVSLVAGMHASLFRNHLIDHCFKSK